ncbi:MAG: hypothetical protein Tsb009_08600 [Planctomycetaceae bacterium]
MAGRKRSGRKSAKLRDMTWLPIKESRFATTALTRLRTEKSTTLPRMVYLYGVSGSGKTHLLRAFLKEIAEEQPESRNIFLTASTLVENVQQAISQNRMDDLREDYRSCDYFICEDLSGFRRHKSIQKTVVEMIDEILAQGGRVVLTATTTPSDVGSLIPRLRNRCHAACLAELSLPGPKSREKLIGHLAQQNQLPITDEAIRLLAKKVIATPRELMAIVHQLEISLNLHKNRMIDSHLLKQFLAREEPTVQVQLSELTRTVAKHYGLSVAKLRDSSRQRLQVTARQCAMFLARKLSKKPFTEIAHYFGKKNHSTVVHACRQITSRIHNDADIRHDLKSICSRLGVSHGSVVENLSVP